MLILPEIPLAFKCGIEMKNRFMLAPLTNTQSFEDGRLSDVELNWLAMRAKGQFGLVMTAASHVQEVGKGFSGQLGIFSDKHIKGHQKLSSTLNAEGCIAVIQLHHAGMRSPKGVIAQQAVSASDNEEHNAKGLSLNEVHQLRNDFIEAALRAKESGYDGVEVHGAHGYIISQFISKEINHRKDNYGGNLLNRARLLFEIVDGIRKICGRNFLLGVRLSPERFGMDLGEIKQIAQLLIDEDQIDFLDISLWDCYKMPDDENYKDQTLLKHFTSLKRNKVRLTVAGNIKNGQDVHHILNSDVDFVSIGKAGILHHDFPKKVLEDSNFISNVLPVTKDYLRQEGLGEKFISYLESKPGVIK